MLLLGVLFWGWRKGSGSGKGGGTKDLVYEAGEEALESVVGKVEKGRLLAILIGGGGRGK